MTGEVDSTLKGRAVPRYGISRISFLFFLIAHYGAVVLHASPPPPVGVLPSRENFSFGAQTVLFVLSMRHVVPRQEHEK